MIPRTKSAPGPARDFDVSCQRHEAHTVATSDAVDRYLLAHKSRDRALGGLRRIAVRFPL